MQFTYFGTKQRMISVRRPMSIQQENYARNQNRLQLDEYDRPTYHSL